MTSNVNDYFVANEMMDSLGWGVVLMLLGDAVNEITGSAYVMNHVRIDLLMLAVLAAAILSLCLFPGYVKRMKRDRKRLTALRAIAFHLFSAVFIVLLVPVFFATPLWVAKAFVPDVFITVVVSSALFFAGGCLRACALHRHIK